MDLHHAAHAQRGGGHPLARPLRAGGGLDVHRDARVPDDVLDRVLDLVHGVVAALQALQALDADDHVGEHVAPGLAHAHRADLAHPGNGPDDALDALLEACRGAIHQRAPG